MGDRGEGYLSVADDLRSAVAKNPYMKVLFASGYYDLATPYFSANYTINRLDTGPQARNVTHTFYQGGHMMYHHLPSLRLGLPQPLSVELLIPLTWFVVSEQ
jgi:carboxypeptidase C (cathepsin A)